ncbi:hypothetical protein B0F90DRAFT_1728925 [Multifurca ochricompacta]|uniref:Uncharacterized protein n=1 Tax=Multifurca ochricompacta TaxID=376703 RepID=A0AAD4M263_9AGAM|nr:hypothetical protein B0F90DRAFT_1728925 [Multifurca ochricompacta]
MNHIQTEKCKCFFQLGLLYFCFSVDRRTLSFFLSLFCRVVSFAVLLYHSSSSSI